MHVHNKYLLLSLLATVITMTACSHSQPPTPAAQKGSVASSFGTPDATSTANAAPPPPPVVNPIAPGQATFGPGPKPGFERTARPATMRPEVASKMAQLEAKAQARRDEAAAQEVIGAQAASPPPPPPDQGH